MKQLKWLKKRDKREKEEQARTSEMRLRDMAQRPKEELYRFYHSSPEGLSPEQAEASFGEHGENVIKTEHTHTVWTRLREAVINPFNVILLVIAAVTYATDVLSASTPDYLTVVIILALVLLSSVVAFVQSRSSDKAAEALTDMISNTVHVLRGGELREILLEDVVPGDVVKLSAGDMLPADVRFLQTKDTFISQAALTGESQPVEKFSHDKEEGAQTKALSDLSNIGLMGSDVVSGSALALVLHSGNKTYFSSIADSLSGDKARSSFERGVNAVSRLLIRMMLLIIPVIFLINGLVKGDWLSALLFAISIAVGLTPEMLPVIMTSTLAKGAVTMSKHQVIVRTLGAIQTFGEMDILCTDKTGTLTEDKIVLERYMNLHGQDDRRVLRHAYLNSHFQTGLKNLIDLAIINRAESYGLNEYLPRYTRIDEVPFDFSRRRMSVILRDQSGKSQLITKGAVEEMLSICSFVEIEGQVRPLGEAEREIAMATYLKHNNDGLRMLAVAQKNDIPDVSEFSVRDESEMVLIGFVGFLDPPKESAGAAIRALLDHGVRPVVLTGDSEGVALKVCRKVGIDVREHYTGTQVEAMDEAALAEAVKHCNLFSKLSPKQKERVVEAFQKQGHTVGYMGDGINDTPAMRRADVGISVDSAVDIAKETADIILLKKDLKVLEEGILAGRRTFGNIMKYIKMAASGNFGNMISVIFASIFLPFLPMLPVHILTQNLLNDFAQMGMPFDNVDSEFVAEPQRWETQSIKHFMAVMGPLSSIFDILCFLVLWFILGANNLALAPLFHAGWFVFGTISQVVIIHMIRTAKKPFIESKPAKILTLSTVTVLIITLLIGFTPLAISIDLMQLPLIYMPWLALLIFAYSFSVQHIKHLYIKKFGAWI